MIPRSNSDRARETGAWFRQPVFWLAVAVFIASLGACIVTIVLAARHPDAPVETGGGKLMGMPLRTPAAAPPRGTQ